MEYYYSNNENLHLEKRAFHITTQTLQTKNEEWNLINYPFSELKLGFLEICVDKEGKKETTRKVVDN